MLQNPWRHKTTSRRTMHRKLPALKFKTTSADSVPAPGNTHYRRGTPRGTSDNHGLALEDTGRSHPTQGIRTPSSLIPTCTTSRKGGRHAGSPRRGPELPARCGTSKVFTSSNVQVTSLYISQPGTMCTKRTHFIFLFL